MICNINRKVFHHCLSCYCCVEIPYECQMSMGNKEPNGSPLQSMGEENALGFVSYF